ncbi:Uncharacterised protein [Amycolatopsis camponoti]|uniref:Uncharacterized protein n=1 Tax=Amycolatopsis camponoti TaxID=2606593 RepID=A0A6I8LXA9_9PSEU|nr:Uncharacterised protein [Amycolatopsis camponoti]
MSRSFRVAVVGVDPATAADVTRTHDPVSDLSHPGRLQ